MNRRDAAEEDGMDPNDITSPALRELLAPDRLPPLGPGTPNRDARAGLEALHIDNSFAPRAVADRGMAECCLAGLWLLHNYLDESHRLSQEIHTASGSYWHGLMHRREPDASNAAYWFRRVGTHPVFEQVGKDAQALGLKLAGARWNPFAFIDLCEEYRGTGGEQEKLLCRVQRREWELLFDFCYGHAIQEA
jgi:hypothetical protein